MNQCPFLSPNRAKPPAAWSVNSSRTDQSSPAGLSFLCSAYTHLSLIRTELFFRQVLGRILRLIPGISNDRAWLFSFAEPSLVEFAERLQQDIPGNILKIEKAAAFSKLVVPNTPKNCNASAIETASKNIDSDNWSCLQPENIQETSNSGNHRLLFRLQGQYKQQVFSIF